MRAIRFTSTALLSLLLAIAAPAYAQQGQRDEKQDHDQQKQNKHEQAKPEVVHAEQTGPHRGQQQSQKNRHDAQKTQQQEQNKQQVRQQPGRSQHQDQQQQAHQQQPNHQQPKRTKQQVQRSAWQRHGSQNWASDHRTWQQRGGYHGYRIPDERFRGYFGPSHRFRIYGLPFMVVGGYPRFQYEGYWFSPVDPWPTYWGNDWYDNDDVYVNYVDNGYYLYNRRYPQQGIAINITF